MIPDTTEALLRQSVVLAGGLRWVVLVAMAAVAVAGSAGVLHLLLWGGSVPLTLAGTTVIIFCGNLFLEYLLKKYVSLSTVIAFSRRRLQTL